MCSVFPVNRFEASGGIFQVKSSPNVSIFLGEELFQVALVASFSRTLFCCFTALPCRQTFLATCSRGTFCSKVLSALVEQVGSLTGISCAQCVVDLLVGWVVLQLRDPVQTGPNTPLPLQLVEDAGTGLAVKGFLSEHVVL